MKQLIQSASRGNVEVIDVPRPALMPGTVLVRSHASVVSTGTERSAIEFARKNLVQKASSRPDLVKQLVRKAQTDGPLRAYELARSRLDKPMTPGYSSAGRVIEAAGDVKGIRAEQLVACAGAGYAAHAEVVRVPRNLVAPVPVGVSAEQAAFSTIGAIALHGFRLAEPTLGEMIVVSGLGLIGLLAVQIAKAAGCRVVGIDPDSERAELARTLGADAAVSPHEAEATVRSLTGGLDADAVLVAAAAPSSDPVLRAAELCRDRGRLVVVGAVGLDLDRRPFFTKEISLRVSRSYGPGRYDPSYEEGGSDYPIGYVRWTENRNMHAFLELLRVGAVDVDPLISHRFDIENATRAYDLVSSDSKPLAIVLAYPGDDTGGGRRTDLRDGAARNSAPGGAGDRPGAVGVGFLGAGAFATGTLLPSLKGLDDARLEGVAASSGVSAHAAAERFGFRFATTDEDVVLSDEAVELVAILTRHDQHARQIVRALDAGKHVFCEKPLALDADELSDIARAHAQARDRVLFVGYNRRYAPLALHLKEFLSSAGPKGPLLVQYRVNAGSVPAEHWVHAPRVGGGRIIGEVCHFVDFLGWLTDAEPIEVHAYASGGRRDQGADDVVLTLSFSDGSTGAITYAVDGDRRMPKERVEVFGLGRSAVLDDFRTLELYSDGKRSVRKARLRRDKGHRAEWVSLLHAVSRGADPVPLRSYVATSLTTFAAVESLVRAEAARVPVAEFLEGTGNDDRDASRA